MKIQNAIFLMVFFSSNLFSQENLSNEKNEIKLYKKVWDYIEVTKPVDTNKKIISFNDNYNINQWIFNSKNVGEGLRYRLSYSSDTIDVKVISKMNAIIHIVVFDTLHNVKEEGELKGIGPFCIRQKVTKTENKFNFEYTLYYYLIKNGDWVIYDDKKKKSIQTRYELPKTFNLDQYVKDNINLVEKRRKNYLKSKKLSKDYYE